MNAGPLRPPSPREQRTRGPLFSPDGQTLAAACQPREQPGFLRFYRGPGTDEDLAARATGSGR